MEGSFVHVWEEKITIPTYGTGKPDRNPMFFEKRVYQGSSGVVYPHPVIEKILDEKADKEYTGLFLENRYIKIMVLPELGGRIHMAYDKIKERHFIYYNHVIKPALVGLTGPWISGGIEFNWPQHHRPGTFSPVDYKIVENDDGSKTILVNEIDRMFHTKGMAGFTLYPDKAFIEIKAQLLNTSSLPQTFLWWANPAVKVNDHYQSVFPPDVHAVFDHGKRDVSSFPIATGIYYKVNYAPGTDISMYKNIPVPTSYMAINSQYDFMGGYEHDSQAGMLHVADHHVSPGKKQWTWGHSDFGQAWDRNLTDEDGAYIELMAGVFTDNQPDFTWLMPDEEKTFTQYFLPYHEVGLVKNATKDILLSFSKTGGMAAVKIGVTSAHDNINVVICCDGQVIFEECIRLDPVTVYSKEVPVDGTIEEDRLLLTVISKAGKELIRYEPARNKQTALPASARPALMPDEIDNHEQLFLTAQHLEQYRHATYSPVPYYEKVLARDAGDIRCNNALGLWYLRRGQFAQSRDYFNSAIKTITERNPNPADCEPYYNLGIALLYAGEPDKAYDALYKAAWDNRWKDSAYFRLAQIDLMRHHPELALEHIDVAIRYNAGNSKAYALKAAALRKMSLYSKAIDTCTLALQHDPFNLGVLYELSLAYGLTAQQEAARQAMHELLTLARGDEQNFMAYALDYTAAGLYAEAAGLMMYAEKEAGTHPMVYYYLAWFHHHLGQPDQTMRFLHKAAAADPYLCFPNRPEDIIVLKFAIPTNPADAKAPYYLGNLFYDKRQYPQAIENWEMAAGLDNSFPTVLRNLGIAYFNKQHDTQKALACFERAYQLDTSDARVFMELDQLYKRLNKTPAERIRFMKAHMETVLLRDDVYLEYISLLNGSGFYREALDLIMQRKFHPWEGGEGKASGQYLICLVQLAKEHIENSRFEEAIALLQQARVYPHNLGEGKLYGTQENDICYWLGCAWEGLHNRQEAENCFIQACAGRQEPSAAIFYNDQQPDKIFYQGLAWHKLGNPENATRIFNNLVSYGHDHMNDTVSIDYFAVSLPDLLVFEDDLQSRNRAHCNFMLGLGYLGLERYAEARTAFHHVLQSYADHVKARIHLSLPNKL